MINWLAWAPLASGLLGLIGLVIASVALSRLKTQNTKLAKLEQRLHATEQMQAVLSRSYRGISQSISQAKTQNDGDDARYQRASQMITRGASPNELAKSLDIPIEEAELMAQIQAGKSRA